MLNKKLSIATFLIASLFLQESNLAYANTLSEDNESPVANNISVKISHKKKSLTIAYTLFDKENDSVTVRVVLVDSSNNEIQQEGVTMSGDIGFPVFTSPKKHILLQFNDAGTLARIDEVRLIVSDFHQPAYRKLLHDFDSTRLWNNLLQIGGERNLYSELSTKHLEFTRNMIREKLKKAGMSIKTQSFVANDIKGENIIGELRCNNQPGAKTIVIGAHYDTVDGSPGVDDNGTGLAALIEVAAILSNYNFKYNIQFVAFDLEESIKGMRGSHGIEGSSAFVKQNGIQGGQSTIGFINLDMLGYYSVEKNSQQFPEELKSVFPDLYKTVENDSFRGDFLLEISNEASSGLSDDLKEVGDKYFPGHKVINVMVPGNGKDMPDFRRSDHANFWDMGCRAISLGDGAFSRNPHYHSAKDKIEDINREFFQFVTGLLLLTVAKESEMNNATTSIIKISDAAKNTAVTKTE